MPDRAGSPLGEYFSQTVSSPGTNGSAAVTAAVSAFGGAAAGFAGNGAPGFGGGPPIGGRGETRPAFAGLLSSGRDGGGIKSPWMRDQWNSAYCILGYSPAHGGGKRNATAFAAAP